MASISAAACFRRKLQLTDRTGRYSAIAAGARIHRRVLFRPTDGWRHSAGFAPASCLGGKLRPSHRRCLVVAVPARARFRASFKQPIERAGPPPPLQKLSFDYRSYFNQTIADISWPDSLQRLAFGYGCNRPVDNVRWPVSLEELSIGLRKDREDNQTTMYSEFDKSIGSSAWPASLRRLTLGHEFRQSWQGLGTSMPNLEMFTLLLDEGYDSGDESLLRGIESHDGLRQLAVFEGSNLDGVVFPSIMQVLHFYNSFFI